MENQFLHNKDIFIGGKVTISDIFDAPADRRICIIDFELVPLTILSSITTACFFLL